jgi:hypothetical protein
MARKKYSDETINDLAESVYFRKPESPTPTETPAVPDQDQLENSSPLVQSTTGTPAPERTNEATNERSNVRTSVRTPVRIPAKRVKTRYAFEFFQDQLDSLKQFALDEQLIGERGNMSAMVREAIDAYISKRNRRG